MQLMQPFLRCKKKKKTENNLNLVYEIASFTVDKICSVTFKDTTNNRTRLS